MLKRLLLLIVSLSGLHAAGQTPVWSTDIAPILYNSCASCHNPNGIAPFSLITYNDALLNSTQIKAAVQSKHMPPWPPDPDYKRLAHERLLAQSQIDRIVNWVNGGSPQGNPGLAPPPPVFNTNGDLPGTPDLITKIPTYTSTATNGDVYQCFVVPGGVSATKFITAFEAIPGNRPLVHHVLVYADTTGVCAQLDAASPGPGYTSFGGVGHNNVTLLGGWVPGTTPIQYPAGFGVRLPPNADIVLQIHYPAGTSGQQDSTEVHFFFSPSPAVRNLSIEPVLNHFTTLQNGPLFIPANTTKTFTEKYDVPNFVNVSVLGVAPHMHLIGRNIESFAVSPANDTLKLIRINDWDFHWQGFYLFKKIQKLLGGSSVYANAFYDNTTANPENPNNPPQDVSAGEATTDEMMIVYFIYTHYQPGDENIVIDATDPLGVLPLTYYHGQQLLEVYPNPAKDELIVKCYLENKDQGGIDIIGMDGRLVKMLLTNQTMDEGYKAHVFSVGELPTGLYQVLLRTSERVLTQKLLIQH